MMTNASSNGPLVSICCDPDEQYLPESSCYRNDSVSDEITLPEIYDSNFSISTMSPGGFDRGYEFTCNGSTYDLESHPPKSDLFHLMENGSIYVKKSIDGGADYWLGTEDYCLSSRPTENGTRIAVSVCGPFLETESYSYTVMSQSMIYLVTISLSLPFLAATFLVYTILPELKNVHGSILRVYVACLFVFNTSFLVLAAHPEFLCVYYMGVVLHFLVLAIFFWLNVMSFDIWWTFRRFRSVHGSSAKGNRKKFMIYSIYAWGSSALVAGVGWIIDSLPNVPEGMIRPGLRSDGCWFDANNASGSVWLYGPMALTIICNTCFFVLSAVTIIRHEKNTARRLKGCENRRHNDEKQRLHVYLKLFIVMGITWSAEFVSAKFENVPSYMTYILDLPNLLQGVTIFVIFVWKDKIKRLLRKRLECKDRSKRSKSSMDRTYDQSSPDTCTTSTGVTTKLREYSDISSEQSKHVTDESRYL